MFVFLLFSELNKTAKLKGANVDITCILNWYSMLSYAVVCIQEYKRRQNNLARKSPTFRAAKFHGLTAVS